MTKFEYRVVPAPTVKGRIQRQPNQLAQGLEAQLNEQSQDGWEFVRTDVVSVQSKRFLRKPRTELTAVVIYRRATNVPQQMPQLVLSQADVVRTAVPSFIKSRPVSQPSDSAENTQPSPASPPRIENAVRGFGRTPSGGTGMDQKSKRPPLVAARPG